MVESALLIGVYSDKADADEAASLLVELEDLVGTLSIGIAESMLVKVRGNHPSHLMGCLLYTSPSPRD